MGVEEIFTICSKELKQKLTTKGVVTWLNVRSIKKVKNNRNDNKSQGFCLTVKIINSNNDTLVVVSPDIKWK